MKMANCLTERSWIGSRYTTVEVASSLNETGSLSKLRWIKDVIGWPDANAVTPLPGLHPYRQRFQEPLDSKEARTERRQITHIIYIPYSLSVHGEKQKSWT
ncbi:hypothetical protein MRX96_017607 [Rhipicephalus microplus]